MDGKRELPLVARMIALAIETRHELKIFPTCWEWWHSFTYSWNKVTLHLFWMHCTTITFDKVKLIDSLKVGCHLTRNICNINCCTWIISKKNLQHEVLWCHVNETDGGFIVARFHSQSAPPGGRVSAFKSNRDLFIYIRILSGWVYKRIVKLNKTFKI